MPYEIHPISAAKVFSRWCVRCGEIISRMATAKNVRRAGHASETLHNTLVFISNVEQSGEALQWRGGERKV